MKINYTLNHTNYTSDLSKPLDISISLEEGEQNPNCYYADNPIFETIRFGDSFVGSVAERGSCNYQKISITPHGNGTHTECYGHLHHQENTKITINNCLKTFWFVARLISITPTKITEKELSTNNELKEIAELDDEVILKKDVEEKLVQEKVNISFEALLLRTLPNSDQKKTKNYSGKNPIYLEPSVGKFLAQKNITHLLLDLPSVDRESDGGKLSVHKGFWNIENGDFSNVRTAATITELIFVDNSIKDGIYLLNLQIPSLESDAAPSKPVLYEIERIGE